MNLDYQFQYNLLPNWTYNAPQFIGDLIKDGVGATLYSQIKSFYEREKAELPYKEEDFRGFHARLDDDTYVIVMKFPKPEETPLCYAAFIFIDVKTDEKAYYTLERGINLDGSLLQFMCFKDREGGHHNYGSADPRQHPLDDIILIRYFYARFRALEKVRIPQEPLKGNDRTGIYKCPVCGHEIIFESADIKEGEELLLFCERCAVLYRLKYHDGEYAIINRIKQEE